MSVAVFGRVLLKRRVAMPREQKREAKMLRGLLTGKARVAMIVATLLLCSTLAVGARAWLTATVEMVAITINATGFAPSETTLPSGTFTLTVINQSGVEGLALKLTRDGGELVQEIALPHGAQQTSVELTLPAGGYTLTEASHPAWLFHITAQ
jgi:hypothetical protein